MRSAVVWATLLIRKIRGNLSARLASGEFQVVERSHAPARQFTTARTIEAEQEILRRVREGRNQVQPLTTRAEAIQIAEQHPHLNRAQKNVIEDVLSSSDRIQGIQGYAGVGKTTALTALRSAIGKNKSARMTTEAGEARKKSLEGPGLYPGLAELTRGRDRGRDLTGISCPRCSIR